MQITKKINNVKKSINETEELIDNLISNLQLERAKVLKKEDQIIEIKEEVRININQIDEIIEDCDANS